jgi:hypothetical protein
MKLFKKKLKDIEIKEEVKFEEYTFEDLCRDAKIFRVLDPKKEFPFKGERSMCSGCGMPMQVHLDKGMLMWLCPFGGGTEYRYRHGYDGECADCHERGTCHKCEVYHNFIKQEMGFIDSSI